MHVSVRIPPAISIAMGCGLFGSHNILVGSLSPLLTRPERRSLSYYLMKGGALYTGPATQSGDLWLSEVDAEYRSLEAWAAICLREYLQGLLSTLGDPETHFEELQSRFEKEGAASLLERKGVPIDGLTIDRAHQALVGLYAMPPGIDDLTNSWRGTLSDFRDVLAKACADLNDAERAEVKRLYFNTPKSSFSSEEWAWLERAVERMR